MLNPAYRRPQGPDYTRLMSAPPPLDNPLASDVAGELVRELRARLDVPGLSPEGAATVRLNLARALYAQHRHREAIVEGEALIDGLDVPPEVRVRALGVLA